MDRRSYQPTSDEGMRARLALALILMIAGIIAVLMFVEIPPGNRDILFTVVGALVAKASDVYGYSFGDSAGRAKQGDTLNVVAHTARAAQVAASSDPGAITLGPNEQATVTSTNDGATVQKDPP